MYVVLPVYATAHPGPFGCWGEHPCVPVVKVARRPDPRATHQVVLAAWCGLTVPFDHTLGRRRDHRDVATAFGLRRVAELIRGEHAVDLQRAAGAREPKDVRPPDSQGLSGAASDRPGRPPRRVILVARRRTAAAMPLAPSAASTARGNPVGTRADEFPESRGIRKPENTLMCRVFRPVASPLIPRCSRFQAQCRGFEPRLPLY